MELPNGRFTFHVNVFKSRKMVLRFSLYFNLLRKNTLQTGLSTKPVLLVLSLKIIVLSLFCLSEIVFFGARLQAEGNEKRLQSYVKNAKNLKDNKRKARRVAAQKTNGRVVKYYLIRKSVAQSKKSKAKTAVERTPAIPDFRSKITHKCKNKSPTNYLLLKKFTIK